MGYSKKELFYFMKPDYFYQRDEIKMIQKENDGYEFLHIYDKLIIMTMNNKGLLAYVVGKKKQPYTFEDIARDIGHTVDKVEKAMQLFYEYGLAIYNDDGTSTFPDAITFTKRRTEGAIKKEQQRKETKDKCPSDKEDKCLTYKYKEQELEQYQHLEKDKEQKIQYIIDMDTGEVIESNSQHNHVYKEIIDYLNAKTNSNYKYNTNKTKICIDARIKEGFTIEDFKTVIDKKTEEWKFSEYEKYLRPETLFGNKFESYLNQPEIPKQKSLKDISITEIEEALKQEKKLKKDIIDDTIRFY